MVEHPVAFIGTHTSKFALAQEKVRGGRSKCKVCGCRYCTRARTLHGQLGSVISRRILATKSIRNVVVLLRACFLLVARARLRFHSLQSCFVARRLGSRTIRCAMNSSLRTEVLASTSTRSMAMVGTCANITRRMALATLASVPANVNAQLSSESSRSCRCGLRARDCTILGPSAGTCEDTQKVKNAACSESGVQSARNEADRRRLPRRCAHHDVPTPFPKPSPKLTSSLTQS